MENTVRFGLIGMGAISRSHIFAINHNQRAQLAAICDVSETRVHQGSEEFGVPGYTDVSEIIKHTEIDAVTICTPSGFHYEPARQAIEAGIHVLVEKPIEIDLKKIDDMIAAAGKNGVKLGGVFQSRYEEHLQLLKQELDAGTFGDIYSVDGFSNRYRSQEYYDSGDWRGTWAIDGGGCLMNQGIHMVDKVIWLAGDVERTMAIAETAGRNVEVETQARAIVKFASGAVGFVGGSTLAYPGDDEHIEIVGSKGTVVVNRDGYTRLEFIDPDTVDPDRLAALKRFVVSPSEDTGPTFTPGVAVPQDDMGHGPVIDDFVDALLNDRDPDLDGSEARKAVSLIDAIYRSSRENGWVKPQ